MGGAIRLSDANASLANVTLVGNCAGSLGPDCASGTDAGGGLGGGLAAFDRSYQLQRVSVMRNRATGFSGALVTRAQSALPIETAASGGVSCCRAPPGALAAT